MMQKFQQRRVEVIKKSTNGGAREGSGPKVKGPYPRRSVCIDNNTYDLVKAYGEGNFSLGIRKLCKLLEINCD